MSGHLKNKMVNVKVVHSNKKAEKKQRLRGTKLFVCFSLSTMKPDPDPWGVKCLYSQTIQKYHK